MVLAGLQIASFWRVLDTPMEDSASPAAQEAAMQPNALADAKLPGDERERAFSAEVTEDSLFRAIEEVDVHQPVAIIVERRHAGGDVLDDAMAVAAVERTFRGKTAEAAEYWKKTTALDPKYPGGHYGFARIARQKGDFAAAARLARQALALDPGSDEVARFLADALMNAGENQEAIEVLQVNVGTNRRSPVSFYLLGQAYLQTEAFDKAKEAFQKAVGLSPTYTHAYYGLSVACSRLGEEDAARKHRDKFNALKERDQSATRDELRQPKDLNVLRHGAAPVYTAAGNVYHKYGEFGAAEAVWKRGAECDPKAVRCRQALARLYERQGRPAEALKVFAELRAIAPDDPEYELAVAQQQMRLGQIDEAEKALRGLCERLPRWSRPAAALAQLCLHTGRSPEETLRWAHKAVELEPVAAHYFLLGSVYDHGGDRARALAALRRAVELEPDNPQCRDAYEALKK
jgi:tetratricopeptide (TPR) repeat protein